MLCQRLKELQFLKCHRHQYYRPYFEARQRHRLHRESDYPNHRRQQRLNNLQATRHDAD
jgi:hypothetical protein